MRGISSPSRISHGLVLFAAGPSCSPIPPICRLPINPNSKPVRRDFFCGEGATRVLLYTPVQATGGSLYRPTLATNIFTLSVHGVTTMRCQYVVEIYKHPITSPLLMASLNGEICDGCRRQSVVRCPSRGHIWKTRQDRPIVIRNTNKKLASLILLLHSDAFLGRMIFGFKYKLCANVNAACCSTWRQTTPTSVVNRVRHSESVVHNRRPLC